jgi:putative transposase
MATKTSESSPLNRSTHKYKRVGKFKGSNMKKSKFTESQIISILRLQESGQSVADICREYGISQPTFYQWKTKYSGLELSQLKRLKELEAELSQYKRIVAEQTLQITVLKDVVEKKL